jgi:hypothetical protein
LPEKLISFIQRAPALSRDEFCRRYVDVHVPLVLQHWPGMRGYVLNLIEREPRPEEPAVLGESGVPVDAVACMWFDTIEDFTDPSRLYASPAGMKAVGEDAASLFAAGFAYHVSEGVQRDYERTWPEGEASPGMKMVAALHRADGITPEQFVDGWLHQHVPLALAHLVGLWRYVTNTIVAPLTPGAPAIDGIVEVHYREKRRFDSPGGEAALNENTRRLLKPPHRLRVTEYVLKG